MPAASDLLDALGHRFEDRSLFARALTHGSWSAEHPGHPSNERLEFLGDAVLGWVVAAELHDRHPDATEGQLSHLRAEIVCASELASMADELRIGPALRLGRGEESSGGRHRPSILSDAVEALIGAVYLDAGADAAHRVVCRIVGTRFDATPSSTGQRSSDHKSRLHAEIARRGLGDIRYDHTETGPEHDKSFTTVIHLDGVPLGEGAGRSKKQAEQAAAREALLLLGPRSGTEPAEKDSHG